MMKTMLWLILFVFITFSAWAIDTTGEIEAGYDPWLKQMEVKFDIGIPIHIRKTVLMPHFGIDTLIDAARFKYIDENIIYNEYSVGAKFLWSNAWVGFEHKCFHPQNSDIPYNWSSTFNFGIWW